MFTEKFGSYVCDGDTITCEVDGFKATATLHHDDGSEAPWDSECGHGPVSDWTSRSKAPGERVLCEDRRGRRRYYDFAEAVAIAKRDGWGFMPYPLKIEPVEGDHAPYAKRGGRVTAGPYTAFDAEDFNRATAAVYAMHRATFPSDAAYAAAAAERDFAALKAWCEDEWRYYGVSVTIERAGVELVGDYAHALWGIEGNYPGSDNSYFTDVANDLLDEALDDARAKLAELVA